MREQVSYIYIYIYGTDNTLYTNERYYHTHACFCLLASSVSFVKMVLAAFWLACDCMLACIYL